MVFVVTIDDGHIRSPLPTSPHRGGIVPDVSESDILHALARCRTPFLVVAHLHMEEAALLYLLDTDIVEHDILHIVAVTAVNGQTTLIVHLWFCLTNNIDIVVLQVDNTVANSRITMQSYENGMCHIGPQRRIGHADVTHTAIKSFTCGVSRCTIVRVATEHTIEENIATTAKHVQTVTPLRMRDRAHVVQRHVAAGSDGTGIHNQSINQYIL